MSTVEDEQAGAEAYVAPRAGWDRHVATLARSMAYRTEEIDPAGGNAGTVAGRSDPGRPRPRRARHHSARRTSVTKLGKRRSW